MEYMKALDMMTFIIYYAGHFMIHLDKVLKFNQFHQEIFPCSAKKNNILGSQKSPKDILSGQRTPQGTQVSFYLPKSCIFLTEK